MVTDRLLQYFSHDIPLREIEKQELINRTVEKKIKRRQFILQQGDVCKHYNFIVSGCFKMYSVDDNGTEHNIQFAAENELHCRYKQLSFS